MENPVAADDGAKAAAAPIAPPASSSVKSGNDGVKIFKAQSTLGSGKDKAGVKFADAKGGKLAVSVYVENLYYLTSTRYQAAQEAAAASAEQNAQAGCCVIS